MYGYTQLALLNCESWLNYTQRLWLLNLVLKPDVSRASSEEEKMPWREEARTGWDLPGWGVCKEGPELTSVPHHFQDSSFEKEGVLQGTLMLFLSEQNIHLAWE